MRKYRLVINPSNVSFKTVARPSLSVEILKLMKGFTQARSLSFALLRIVGSNSQLKAT
jgi:hypothetical protein